MTLPLPPETAPFVAGCNCLECGRFVGRDGHFGTEFREKVGGVEGTCRRCIDKAWDREVAAERRHLTELTT